MAFSSFVAYFDYFNSTFVYVDVQIRIIIIRSCKSGYTVHCHFSPAEYSVWLESVLAWESTVTGTKFCTNIIRNIINLYQKGCSYVWACSRNIALSWTEDPGKMSPWQHKTFWSPVLCVREIHVIITCFPIRLHFCWNE